ncbi:MAG: hypothetical protein COA50_04705, partial [Flavobacteriaceae bacterium]
GATGATGLTGANGTDGTDGAVGATGLTGANGTDGADGADGDPATNITTNLVQNTTTGVITYTNEVTANQTAIVISADANNSIAAGSDGGAYLKINLGGRWTNSNTSTNLNSNGTVAPIFGTEDYKDGGASFYQVSGNTLIIVESGRYDIRANLSLLGINSSGSSEARTNANARIAINGTAIGARGASGYIRYASNQTQSSIHMSEILELNANDVVTILMYREANSGTVRFNAAGESSFIINKLR